MSIRVFLIDSQELVRSGLRAILEIQSDFEVAGEANDCMVAVKQLSSITADVVLLNAVASGPSIVESARTLTRVVDQRPLRLLILVTELGGHAVDFLKAGASGFLLKTASPEELLLPCASSLRDIHCSPAQLPRTYLVFFLLLRTVTNLTSGNRVSCLLVSWTC
jgi:DNA-binding NarL/FixJ family response regulator